MLALLKKGGREAEGRRGVRKVKPGGKLPQNQGQPTCLWAKSGSVDGSFA